jgi:hypothetical protein
MTAPYLAVRPAACWIPHGSRQQAHTPRSHTFNRPRMASMCPWACPGRLGRCDAPNCANCQLRAIERSDHAYGVRGSLVEGR